MHFGSPVTGISSALPNKTICSSFSLIYFLPSNLANQHPKIASVLPLRWEEVGSMERGTFRSFFSEVYIITALRREKLSGDRDAAVHALVLPLVVEVGAPVGIAHGFLPVHDDAALVILAHLAGYLGKRLRGSIRMVGDTNSLKSIYMIDTERGIIQRYRSPPPPPTVTSRKGECVLPTAF